MPSRRLRHAWLAVLLSIPLLAADAPARQQPAGPGAPMFAFDAPFWLNLHQFLYVLGRAQAKLPNSDRRAVLNAPADQEEGLKKLSPEQQQAWKRAVDAYANAPSRLDAVFDARLVDLAKVLIEAGNQPGLGGLGADPVIAPTLISAAPIYRTAWWPRHDATNQATMKTLDALLAQHGAPVQQFIVRAYGQRWPAGGFPVHFSGYANWAGAFSTRGNILVMSSLDFRDRGQLAFETIFHEAMHQWDDQVYATLQALARGRTVPANLSHAMIFFTAGEAVKSVIPAHVPYADSEGVWNRGMNVFKPALEAVWLPYLRGKGTRDEAMAALLAKVSGLE